MSRQYHHYNCYGDLLPLRYRHSTDRPIEEWRAAEAEDATLGWPPSLGLPLPLIVIVDVVSDARRGRFTEPRTCIGEDDL